MNTMEKVLFCVVVSILLIVGSYILVINQPPRIKVKSPKGLTSRDAMTTSGVADKAMKWNSNSILVGVKTGKLESTTITNTGKSSEWDFEYCGLIAQSSTECKLYRVNGTGIIFNESRDYTNGRELSNWTVDSDGALEFLLKSSELKKEFSEVSRVSVFSMELVTAYFTVGHPYWIIKLGYSPDKEYGYFFIDAITGDFY